MNATSTTSTRSRRHKEAVDPVRLFHEYAQTRSVEARNTLVETHMQLVLNHAIVLHSRLPHEVQFDDLVSTGTLGLIQSVESFDLSRNIKFPSFAAIRIRGAMLDWLRELDHVPRLSRTRVEHLSAVEDQFRSEHGRQPNSDELQARLHVDDEEWKRISNAKIRRKRSIDQVVKSEYSNDSEHEDTFGDTLESKTPPPECDPLHTSLRDTLLRHLKLGEALLIRLYYIDQITMKEIGKMLGRVTETCISCRHKAIMQKMRDAFDQEELSALIGGGYR